MNRDAAQRLEAWLSRALGEPVRVESVEKPQAGSARGTRAVVVATPGCEEPRRCLRLVGGEISPAREGGRARSEEFALLRAAHDAGVRVVRPVALCEDAGVLGGPFFVTDSDRETENGMRPSGGSGGSAGIFEISPPPGRQPDRGARQSPDRRRATELPMASDSRPQPDAGEQCDPGPSAGGGWMQRPEAAARLGRELAKLHRITPPHPGLGFLDPAPSDLPAARIDRFRRRLDAVGDPQPVLEWAMRHLERNAPEGAGTVLCRGAPRAPSGLLEDGGTLSILDREGCRWGDPYEDIGEFCAQWRRRDSCDREGGDGAPRSGFLDGYREVSGLDLDEDVVRYWEVMAILGRAVGALEHGHRFAAGGERSVELALTGRRVAEMEIDLLAETDRLAMERAHA